MLPATWQDWVIAVGSLMFFFALLPSVFGKDKPDVRTSALTAVILTAFMVAYASLGLKFAMFTTALVAVAWYVLFYQKAKVWFRNRG